MQTVKEGSTRYDRYFCMKSVLLVTVLTCCAVGLNSRSLRGSSVFTPSAIAVYMTHGKVENLERAMTAFFTSAHHEKFPVMISLDHEPALAAVTEMMRRLEVAHNVPDDAIKLVLKPDQSYPEDRSPKKLQERKIDDHLWYGMRRALDTGHEFVIWIEDDIVIAPDFLQMMVSGMKRLREDKTLFCIAGWNENSLDGEAEDLRRLIRTNIHPGWGWMMHRAVLEELVKSWPGQYVTWDWWFARPDVTKGRECIAPEVPRSKHIGADGVHYKNNDLYEQMAFANIPADENTFDFESIDLVTYDEKLAGWLAQAELLRTVDEFAAVFNASKSGFFLMPIVDKNTEKAVDNYLRHFRSFYCSHRGLLVKKRPETNTVFLFAHTRNGPEWLPKDLRAPLPRGVHVVLSAPGENCVQTCARLVVPHKRVCSFDALRMMQNCDFCPSQQCENKNLFHTHNGLIINQNDQTCSLSTFSSIRCDEAFPGFSRICPCT